MSLAQGYRVLPTPYSLPHLCFHHDFSLCAGKMQAPFRSFRRKCPAFVPTGEYGKKGVPACGLTLLLFMVHPLLEVLLENLRFRNSYPVDFANWKKIQVCLLWLSYPMEGAPSTGHIRCGLPPIRRWKPCWKRFRMAAVFFPFPRQRKILPMRPPLMARGFPFPLPLRWPGTGA